MGGGEGEEEEEEEAGEDIDRATYIQRSRRRSIYKYCHTNEDI
jgi:hypothetical protein